ncbi:uncharacterized protein L203_105008 [Cryptococcus depauperatus CBS 7841]|uniref:Serine/threonine-protein kinase RIO2 n=1 Tax=Cryptococcus depauperatus CBS 7841 TaxID=1295531 RepID=A0AAJ8JWK4_9TREE
MRLDATDLRFLSADDFRVLTAVEIGSRNHESVPSKLIAEISQIRGGNVKKSLGQLARRKLVARVQNIKYDGFRLTYGGLDYLALRTFSRRKTPSVQSVGNKIGVGKESDIYVVADEEGDKRVMKMHRLGRISFRAIKNKRDYLGKRRSASWMYMSRLSAEKEFAFMKALYQHGFPVPIPIDQARHCIVMSLIDGYPLRAVEKVDNPAELYSKLMELIVRFAHAGLIHGDFNEFNIMLKRKTEEPIVIDFPQMVSTRHENAEYFFNRDVNCVRRFFKRRFRYEGASWPMWRDVVGVEEPEKPLKLQAVSSAGENELYKTELQRLRIDLEVEASGFGRAVQEELEHYMVAVQDLPPSDDEEEEEEDDNDDEEHGSLSQGTKQLQQEDQSDETSIAASLEAIRLHRALGNDSNEEDVGSEHSVTDALSDCDSESSEGSTGYTPTDFTSHAPSTRNQRRYQDRLPSQKLADKDKVKDVVAKQVERERQDAGRKHHAGKSGVHLGKQKGHKWKSSSKYLLSLSKSGFSQLDGFKTGTVPLTSRCFAQASPFVRLLHTSSTKRALFGNKSRPSSTPDSALNDSETHLTPFQEKIAELEIAAHANKEEEGAQLALLRKLLEGGEYAGLVAYYEGVALADDGTASQALLKSEEGWAIFMEALAKNGRLMEVVAMVRKRDRLLASSGAKTSSAPTTSASSTILQPPSNSAPSPPASNVPLLASSLLRGPSPASSQTLQNTSNAGSPLNPIYVQMAPPTPQMNALRLLRWIGGFLLWGFIILTVLSMVMENTGLLKAGPGPVEFEPEEGKVVKFSDVHGVEEAKTELEEIVEFLRNPEKFSSLGGKLPKGVLLTGPPGTGKTMLARAVAGEAEVPFLFASGSSFDEMFVGVGAKRVRELFAAARKKAPAIIFIDELDAIGSKRSAKDQHYMKQTLNQLLVELDGFEQSEGVIIIAATNFPESLDKALTRPGRFDRHVVVGLPDVRGRIEILKHHMSEVKFDVDVDPSIIARGCPGMSGADLQNLVNQAAVKASRDGEKKVQLKHFEWAKDRILMGAERRSHYVTEESKRATAYHEGGHALVALHTSGAMPLHKVTIMPRGQALGITFQLPEQDKDSYTRREYNAMIDVALGGRAAEEMIFGHDDVTSGCSSDLQRATDVAARMIRNYGFSDKVGLVAHGDEESVYLSGKKKDEIESEIRGFLDAGMSRAANLLKTHEDELHRLAEALVEYETLSLHEVREVLAGKRLDRPTTGGERLKGNAEREGQGQVVDGI